MRYSGILMHISSLPGPYGIGTLGTAAKEFIDFLQRAGQHYWQILPVGPTGYGDSPYQSFSAFAGSHYLIDPEQLIREGLLLPEEAAPAGGQEDRVDYGRMFAERPAVLERAFGRFDRTAGEYADFCGREAFWLEDYALFMALKNHFDGASWIHWPEEIRTRKPEAMDHFRSLLAEETELQRFCQYQFARQWQTLRAYAHERGIEIIGDIPIYVPMDSADVWAAPGHFQLDENLTPLAVAGCPPDTFTADGQLWGNPLYNWNVMKEDGYAWWIRRLQAESEKFDVIRIDHFRGIESYWAIPFGSSTAAGGKWVKGPGMDLIRAIKEALPEMRFIAEDLGFVTPEVEKLVEESGFPGMKVLEFAFDSRENGDYMPHNFQRNCVCYTGTHDNETLVQWWESIGLADYELAARYLGKSREESICSAVIRCGMASVADTFLVQMQDWLELGAEARMNQPGSLSGNNWRWRLRAGQLSEELAGRIAACTKLYGR